MDFLLGLPPELAPDVETPLFTVEGGERERHDRLSQYPEWLSLTAAVAAYSSIRFAQPYPAFVGSGLSAKPSVSGVGTRQWRE